MVVKPLVLHGDKSVFYMLWYFPGVNKVSPFNVELGKQLIVTGVQLGGLVGKIIFKDFNFRQGRDTPVYIAAQQTYNKGRQNRDASQQKTTTQQCCLA